MPTTVRGYEINILILSSASLCKYTSSVASSGMFSDPWMMGAAASAFYINDAATVFPKAIVAKARTYFAGAYADVLEVRGFAKTNQQTK